MSGFGIFLCCEIVKWGLYYRLHESLGYCISLNFLIRQKTITCDTLFSLWIPLYHCDDDKVEDDCKMLRIRRSFPRDCTFAPSRCLRLLQAAIHSSHLLIISNIMVLSLTTSCPAGIIISCIIAQVIRRILVSPLRQTDTQPPSGCC